MLYHLSDRGRNNPTRKPKPQKKCVKNVKYGINIKYLIFLDELEMDDIIIFRTKYKASDSIRTITSTMFTKVKVINIIRDNTKNGGIK